MPTDWEKVRAEFPALSNWTYLNTATFGQLPLRTIEAVSRHFTHRDELACSDFLAWFDDADSVRAQVAQLIHCSAEDVAFVPNASSGLSLFLSGIAWKPGDQVLVLDNEFPNNIYAPLTQPVEFVETPWERFYDSVTSRTRAVLMSTASYTNGFQPPLEEIGKFLRDRGVLFYLDGTQSLGARVFDTRKVQPDMLSVHGYKWLLAPNGSGFIYVRPEVRQWLRPAVVGWRSDRDWRNVDHLNHGAPVFTGSAEKYEGAMLPFPAVYALGASVGLFLEIGPEEVERRVMQLAGEAACILERRGASVLHRTSHILAARFEGVDTSQLAKRLKERRILVSSRHGSLRVSVHLYNNPQDLQALDKALVEELP